MKQRITPFLPPHLIAVSNNLLEVDMSLCHYERVSIVNRYRVAWCVLAASTLLIIYLCYLCYLCHVTSCQRSSPYFATYPHRITRHKTITLSVPEGQQSA